MFRLTLGTLHPLTSGAVRAALACSAAATPPWFLPVHLLVQVSLSNRRVMLVSQHIGSCLPGRPAADTTSLGCHPQYSSSRPVARRASLKVSAFESQTQPWKKSPASSSRYVFAVGLHCTKTPSNCLLLISTLHMKVQASPDDFARISVVTDMLDMLCRRLEVCHILRWCGMQGHSNCRALSNNDSRSSKDAAVHKL